MLLKHGYNDLGIQSLLDATQTPKGSFYHHFKDKEDFALQVLDQYMIVVHATLDDCLANSEHSSLDRVRSFFEATQQQYQEQGYLGCLMGGLGQELSGVNEQFRLKIEECLSGISARIAMCLEEARKNGEIAADLDVSRLADVLTDSWEGAVLRSRLRRNPSSLTAMLDFYFESLTSH